MRLDEVVCNGMLPGAYACGAKGLMLVHIDDGEIAYHRKFL